MNSCMSWKCHYLNNDLNFKLYKCRSRENFSQFVRRVSLRLNLKVRRKMKIILLIVVLLLAFSNSLAEKTITCKKELMIAFSGCRFSNVTIGPNESVTIKTDPADLDVNRIEMVEFSDSSIHSIPRKIFLKFPNLEILHAIGQNIQEIKRDTFVDAKKLTLIDLGQNELTFLRSDTFEG